MEVKWNNKKFKINIKAEEKNKNQWHREYIVKGLFLIKPHQ